MAHFGSKGPFGGGVNVAISYDSLVYLGTFNGGVYISTNSKLVSWTARPVGLKSGKITALAHSGKYLFAGTADSGVYVFNGFVGSDRYWNKINNGLGNLKITSMVALDTATVMVGTKGGGIFLTTNRGQSWTAVNNPVLHHLEISYALKAGNRIIHASVDGGVYASDNKGASWISLNDSQTDDISVSAISYNSVTDELLVANADGVYKTSAASTTTNPAYGLVETGLPSSVVVKSISNDGTNWYVVTDQGVFTSVATAINWVKIETGKINDATVVVPFRNNLVVGTQSNGVLKSLNPASTWTPVAVNFNNLKTYSMVTSGDALVIAATEKGVFVSKDLAASYVQSNKGLTDSLNVNDLAYGSGVLLAATKNAGVFFSSDSGRTWTTANNGLTNMNVKKVYILGATKYAITADNNIYTAPLQTDAWALIQAGLPSGLTATSFTSFGDKLLLGTLGNGVFVKAVNGAVWVEVNTGLANLHVTSVTTWGSKIYAGTWGSGVFVSDSGAISWTPTAKTSVDHTLTMGLNGDYIQAMASNAGYVYASYKGGLLATSDNGTTWIAGGNQFNLPSYTDVNKISFVTTRVFVTTEYNGLYSNALSELPPVTTGLFDNTIAKANVSIRILPNPNSGNFTLTIAEKVESVQLLDFSGRPVQVLPSLLDQTVQTNVARGVYFVHVKTDKGIAIKKLVIE